MGVDWIRMRPGCDAAVFAAAARAQVTAFMASGSWFTDEFGHLDLPAPAQGPDITALVDVDTRPGNSHRVIGLVLTPLLPAEWRFAMYRSFLPDDLGRHVRRWRTHIAEARGGAHAPYLRAWYAYAASRRLAAEWSVLRELAMDATGRTNAWATRPTLIDVRDRILARPAPAVSPAPTWGGTYDTHSVDAAPYAELARECNRRVPANQKASVAKPPPFEELLNDPSPDATLDWMESSADEGYGLLLDW